MRILKETDMEEAKRYLDAGGVLIYPTDTVFGIGCLIKFEDSVKRIYRIKGRGTEYPLSVAFHDIAQLKEYASLTPEQEKAIGESSKIGEPMTFIVKKNEKISEFITKEDTVGIRIIDHPIVQKITENGPIITTSANAHNKPAVSKFEDIDIGIAMKVDGVIQGKCKHGKPSKIVNLISGETLRN